MSPLLQIRHKHQILTHYDVSDRMKCHQHADKCHQHTFLTSINGDHQLVTRIMMSPTSLSPHLHQIQARRA